MRSMHLDEKNKRLIVTNHGGLSAHLVAVGLTPDLDGKPVGTRTLISETLVYSIHHNGSNLAVDTDAGLIYAAIKAGRDRHANAIIVSVALDGTVQVVLDPRLH
jgi:hypothetical protein